MVLKKAQFSPDHGNRSMGKDLQAPILLAIAALLLGLIGARLAYIQIVEGDRNRQLAENNRIRLIAKAPERGRILDRYGKIMATNRLSHAIYLWPVAQSKEKWQDTIAKLSEIIKIPASEITRKLEQEGYNSPNKVRISAAISPKLAIELGERFNELKGVEVDPEPVRYYPNGDVAAHVLGYTGELTETELNQLKAKGYRLGDVIGKAGVEYAFEDKFRGVWGGQQVEVDAAGKVIRILGQKPPKAGNTVNLTIDLELQKVAEKALGNLQGGIIAMNPQNGEVLAMASYPNFDPNLFSGRISNDAWQRLTAKDHPFVNRTLQGFPPASTYKIITTTAGLESGKFSPNSYLDTFPYLEVGGIQFWDHNNAGFGTIGFADAIAFSSDTFFYQVGRTIGVDTLVAWTKKFGFGKHTGIELKDEESPGLVPDPEWKQKVLKEQWYVGNTINMSIGQGDLQANLLQVGMMAAVAANGGYLIQPHLLYENTDAKLWRKSLNLAPSTIAVLREGLRRVVTSGTAQALNVGTVAIAGKSGTAEDHPRQAHTWFVGYAPFDKPEIVVVAFGENSGGGGGSVAGPKVLKVIEAYMNLKKSRKS
ncbi:penicillin-binding protein 2 [Synechococcus sp. PCC 7502]|uniref:penicillin-binding protein 2 n=1 Tax=Synechococcus sp. PCC 7502 TaxID=1173263 RepID=UPI00029F927F|nr:penicillin-binding protein 2 [Synechococcus sp. PCC 7502]AFY73254.1 penicillin-binding protein 2 [Synechococcus sp. PCC 7502]